MTEYHLYPYHIGLYETLCFTENNLSNSELVWHLNEYTLSCSRWDPLAKYEVDEQPIVFFGPIG